MKRFSLSGLFIVLIMMLTGCAVHHANGYQALVESPEEDVSATPFVMYGVAPWSYDLPDGRQVLIESISSDFIGPDFAFAITLDDVELTCATNPRGPGIPETRFGCWSSDASVGNSFWMAPDQGCSKLGARTLHLATRPDCWQGELTTPKTRYDVEYSTMKKSKAAVAQISWVDAVGEPVLAVNSIVELRMKMHMTRELDQPERDGLVLNALALHYWYHVSTNS